MKFNLYIRLGNAAMQSPVDIAFALQKLANDMLERTAGDPYEPIVMGEHTRISGNAWDLNGNQVGHWSISEED
jgi:hypothetical protein